MLLSKSLSVVLIEMMHSQYLSIRMKNLFDKSFITFQSFKDNSSGDIPQRRMLRRETAVELPITPSKSVSVTGTSADMDSGGISNINERGADQTSPLLKRNLSGDRRQNYLVPSSSEPTQTSRFKKSIESLPKNSSSDTEYSLQPYRVIKQSSNETNTSLTGSFNIDQSFGAHELSLDTNETSAHYTTVIENIDQGSSSETASLNKSSVAVEPQQQQPPSQQQPLQHQQSLPPITKFGRQQSEGGSGRSLRKQFSIDHSSKFDSSSGNTLAASAIITAATKPNLKLPTISTIPATPTRTLSEIVSSSTSTDESKDDRDIPTISTNVVQDEIAKLSSNINRSDEKDENSSDPPLNETMC